MRAPDAHAVLEHIQRGVLRWEIRVRNPELSCQRYQWQAEPQDDQNTRPLDIIITIRVFKILN